MRKCCKYYCSVLIGLFLCMQMQVFASKPSKSWGLNFEKIISAADSDALIDMMLIIKNMYKTRHGAHLKIAEIFAEGDAILLEHGHELPQGGLIELKKRVRMRALNNGLRATFAKGSDEPLELDDTMTKSPAIETVKFPEKLRYGILLTYCGVAANALSDEALSPFGDHIIAAGLLSLDQELLEYQQNSER